MLIMKGWIYVRSLISVTRMLKRGVKKTCYMGGVHICATCRKCRSIFRPKSLRDLSNLGFEPGPLSPPDQKKTPQSGAFFLVWRRERDSNPRYAINVYSLSRGALSTTQPSLRIGSCSVEQINLPQPSRQVY